MTTMPAVRTTGELYPAPTSAELYRFMSAVATGGRDDSHNALLRRALTTVERQALSDRAGEIAPLLERGAYRKIMRLVAEMLAGFGSARASEEEAEIIAAQYAAALGGLPVWAVERACGRFSRGEVEASEVGSKHLDRAFAPSTAQLRMVADKVVKPFVEDLYRIRMICGGTVERPDLSPEERERVGVKIAEYIEKRKREVDVENETKKQDGGARAIENTKQMVLAEYAAAGVKPVYSENGTLCSLSLYRSVGYTIQDVGGERVLVAPAKEGA